MIAAERPAQAAGIRAREVGHVLGLGHVLTGGRTAPLLHGPARSVCGAQPSGVSGLLAHLEEVTRRLLELLGFVHVLGEPDVNDARVGGAAI